MIREVSEGPHALINPQDARARGIAEGDTVRIFNDRGSIQVPARLDYSLKAGCVYVHNGWWIAERGAVNFLSLGRETDMGHGAAFHDNMVELEKVRG
jgi:anaerobic selenocysteine-containing dehydrogenase